MKITFYIFAVVLPPSPSSASGSQPRKYVADEPPTFHDAVVGMIFRDKKKKTPRLRRASSAESVLKTMEKSPKTENLLRCTQTQPCSREGSGGSDALSM